MLTVLAQAGCADLDLGNNKLVQLIQRDSCAVTRATHHKLLRDGWADAQVGPWRHHSIAVQPEGRALCASKY